MRKTVIGCLVVALVSLGLPSVSFAAARPAAAKTAKAKPNQQTGTITGDAKGTQGEKLAQNKVRIRNSNTGQIASELTTDAAGTFTGNVPAGSYVIEVLGPNGAVIGLSPVVSVAAGQIATISVTASAVAAVAGAAGAAGAAGGGFGLFGLGAVATVAVLGGATAATVVGIKAATKDNNNATPGGQAASPSR